MYTLKIAWTLHEFSTDSPGELMDETTLFIPADKVKVHSVVSGPGAADGLVLQWASQGANIHNYASVRRHVGELTGETVVTTFVDPCRLIEVERDEESTWYLASRAWLLGPDGGTIERIAP